MTLGSEAALWLGAATKAKKAVRRRFPATIAVGSALALVPILVTLATSTLAAPWRVGLGLAGLLGLSLLLHFAGSLHKQFTAEQEHARTLALTQSRLQGLIDASPLAITAGDLEGRVLLWNAAAEEIFGWTADEVLGRRYPAIPKGHRPEWERFRDRVLRGENLQGMEATRLTRDGETIQVTVSAAPVHDDQGRIVGTVALVEDRHRTATARKMEKLETQLRHAQKLEVVGRLSAGIAHDFNNLLTAIRGNAELILATNGSDPDHDHDLREIARATDRAAALTRQLLSFTHQGPVDARPISVNRLVKGMESLMERLIGETVELRVELSVGAGAVLTDPNQIEQVLMNLVVNARDALPDGGRITIRTAASEVDPEEAAALPYEVRPGPFSVITVADNGMGMDPETADRIFEPFFTTKPAGVGTGLGLSTVYSIVKQARGHIRVESEPGQGTRFMVYLPQAEEEQPAPQEELPTPEASGGSETILVVEDEEAVLSLAQRTLERQGYRVLPALSGREALGIALKHPGEIDILFCDVVMPDLTGREVAERVKDARPSIQVLMTSGYGERQLAEEGVLKEVSFLPKPYTPVELSTQIRTLLEPQPEA